MSRPVHAGAYPSKVQWDLSYTMPNLGSPDEVRLYPDAEYLELREAIARFREVDASQVLVGCGSSQFIDVLTQVVSRRSTIFSPTGLVVQPSFSEYRYQMQLRGFNIKMVPPEPDPVLGALKSSPIPDLFFWCNPNNPTGRFTSLTESLLAKTPDSTVLVVDEAYLFQAGRLEQSLSQSLDLLGSNICVLGTASKDFGMPGIRLGYAIFPHKSDLQKEVSDLIPPWPVTGESQKRVLEALRFTWPYEFENWQAVQRCKSLVYSARELGYTCQDSDTAFFLLRKPTDHFCYDLETLFGIQVRDCTDYGLEDWVRIVSRSPESDRALIEALAELRRK